VNWGTKKTKGVDSEPFLTGGKAGLKAGSAEKKPLDFRETSLWLRIISMLKEIARLSVYDRPQSGLHAIDVHRSRGHGAQWRHFPHGRRESVAAAPCSPSGLVMDLESGFLRWRYWELFLPGLSDYGRRQKVIRRESRLPANPLSSGRGKTKVPKGRGGLEVREEFFPWGPRA